MIHLLKGNLPKWIFLDQVIKLRKKDVLHNSWRNMHLNNELILFYTCVELLSYSKSRRVNIDISSNEIDKS